MNLKSRMEVLEAANREHIASTSDVHDKFVGNLRQIAERVRDTPVADILVSVSPATVAALLLDGRDEPAVLERAHRYAQQTDGTGKLFRCLLGIENGDQ